MAARRLIALLVVLLVISSIAAALAPTPAEREGETTSSTTTTESEAPGAGPGEGELLEVTVDVPPPRHAAAKAQSEPETIGAVVGDQLALTVRAEETVAVEIPELGLLETASPGGPARFDLLLRDRGKFAVLAGGRRHVASVVVRAPPPHGKAGGAGSDRSADPPRAEP